MSETRPHDTDLPYFPCEMLDREGMNRAEQQFVSTVEIPVSPEELFAVFEDPDSWPRWAMGIGKVTWTSPKPYGEHTTRTVTFWGGMNVYEDFFIWDAPREIAFSFYGTSERVWDAFAEHYSVTEFRDGGCRLVWTVAYNPSGWFAKMHMLIRPIMTLNFRIYMWRLKRYCKKQQPALTTKK